MTSSFTYNQVPYPWLSHSNTHPDRLATMARLVGMQPATVENCRVLELGCASGGNLIPMAYGLPGSTFVGIDLSDQVAEGQARIAALGLKNISLRKMDILDFPVEMGLFDYIIAHGVFSWVPECVQEKVFAICQEHLAPQGVAFISYNTYPGWYLINVARDLMRYQTRKIDDPQERAETARAALKDFAGACNDESNGYYGFLKMYADYINGSVDENDTRKSDAALLHDELEDLNQPYYFHQFIERAGRHGLQYLADLCHKAEGKTRPGTVEVLRTWSQDLVDIEQSSDFLENRTFRQTLLCQPGVTINRNVTPASIRNFYVASRAQPVAEDPNLHLVSVEEFKSYDGSTLTIDHPVSKAAMICLAEAWPQAIKFEDLLSAARRRLGMSDPPAGSGEMDRDAIILGANLLRAYQYSTYLLELHLFAPSVAPQASEQPLASLSARLQAASEGLVTNLWHERVTLDGLDRFMIQYLDGQHTRSDLIDLMIDGPVAEGKLTFPNEAEPPDVERQRYLLAKDVDVRLKWLAMSALLVDPLKLGEEAHGIRESN